jgi:hypothetical protein
VVLELLLLLWCQDCEFPLLLYVFRIRRPGYGDGCVAGGQIVVVGQIWEHVLLSSGPGVVVVVCNVDHMVRVDCSEWGETVTNNGEQSDQDAVDDVDNIDLLSADVDPADEEKYPGQTEECDECGIECDEEAQC